MVDYTKATGNRGTMIIRDDGEWVSFWLSCSDSATNVGSASWSGTVNGVAVGGSYSWSTGGGSKRIGGTWRVSTSQTVTFRIAATGTWGLGGPTSFSVAISRASKPNAPSGLTVTRVSDTRHTLNWSRNSTYTSVLVQRRTENGAWQQIAAPTGNQYTYTDTTTKADAKYDYRVAGRNAGGTSGWSNTVTVYTTPAPPSNLVAKRVGADIQVNTRYSEDLGGWSDFQRIYDNGVLVGDNVHLAEGTPFVHANVDQMVTHTYTARNVKSGLVSVLSTPSNTVVLLAKPNPPGALSPNGAVRPSDEQVLLQWLHNPVDTTDQTAFELQYRSGGAWTTVTGTTAEQVLVPLGVGSFEWQVRTKGDHLSWSDWSAVATVTVVDRPGVAIIAPDAVWDSSILPVEWSWFQAQSRPQSGWEARLLDAVGDPVETRSGSGAASSVTFAARLFEGAWTVQVRGATGDVWSGWAEQGFTVVFIPPAAPVLSGVWDEGQGGVLLEVTPAPAGVVNLFANPSFEDASPIPAGASRVSTWASDGAWSIQIPTDVPSAALLPGASTYPSSTTYPGGA